MPQFFDTVSSPASREVVFDYLANFASVSEWDPSVTEAAALDHGAPGPGARYRVVVRALGRETAFVYETIEFDRPSRVVVRAETSSVVSLDTITFADVGGGTEVAYDAQLRLKGLYRALELPMAIGFKRLSQNAKLGLERELARLGSAT